MKIIGLKWDKERDTLNVMIPSVETPPTKRGVLSRLAWTDPLGFVASLTLTGKQIYREICESKLLWDVLLTSNLLHARLEDLGTTTTC